MALAFLALGGLFALGRFAPATDLDLEAKRLGRSAHRQRDPAPLLVDIHDLDVNLVAHVRDLVRRLDVPLRHLRDVHEAFDTVAQLHEPTEWHQLGDRALDDRIDREVLDELLPRILGGLLQAEADALAREVDVEYLHVYRVAHLDDLGRMVHMAPAELRDVHESVDAAQVDEGSEVDDARDRARKDHPLLQLAQNLGALVLAALLEHHSA